MREEIESLIGLLSERMKVLGGWIVRTVARKGDIHSDSVSVSISVHQIFISDPKYRWKLDR